MFILEYFSYRSLNNFDNFEVSNVTRDTQFRNKKAKKSKIDRSGVQVIFKSNTNLARDFSQINVNSLNKHSFYFDGIFICGLIKKISTFQSHVFNRISATGRSTQKFRRAIVVVESKGNAQLLDRVYSIAGRFIKQTIARVARKKLIFRGNKCTLQRNDSRKWREGNLKLDKLRRLITIRVALREPVIFHCARNVFRLIVSSATFNSIK